MNNQAETVICDLKTPSEHPSLTDEDPLAKWGTAVASAPPRIHVLNPTNPKDSGFVDGRNKTHAVERKLFGEAGDYLAFVRRYFAFGIGPENLRELLVTHRGYRANHLMLNCVHRPFTANVFPTKEHLEKMVWRMRNNAAYVGRLQAMIYPIPLELPGPRLADRNCYTPDWFMDLLERTEQWQFAISSLSPTSLSELNPQNSQDRYGVPNTRSRAYALILQRMLGDRWMQMPYPDETELVFSMERKYMGLQWRSNELTCVAADRATHVCLMPPVV